MAVVHIPEAEAARDFASVIARASAGEEVVIDRGTAPAVVIRAVVDPHLRRLSDSLRLAEEHGSTATLDGDFGRDLMEVIGSHPEPLRNPWE